PFMKSTLQPLSTLALAIFFLFSSSTFGQSPDDFEQTITKGDPHGSIEWTQYGFLPTHTSFNSRENILSRGNVASLAFKWAAEVGPGIASSPVLGRGIVYA